LYSVSIQVVSDHTLDTVKVLKCYQFYLLSAAGLCDGPFGNVSVC